MSIVSPPILESWIHLRRSLAAAVLIAFSAAAPVAAADLESALQGVLERACHEDLEIPGIEAAVFSPARGVNWRGACGHMALNGTEPLSPEHPFRLASVTKAYTAAVLLRLAEQGRLALTDTIDTRISADTAKLLRSGGYDPSAIRIQDLMTHTSGLVDHTEHPEFMPLTLTGRHHFTRHEQVALAMRMTGPLNAPGEHYHYSDTGYVLLGEIIENVTGETLARAMRRQLKFAKLNLRATWFDGIEQAPQALGGRAHQYVADGNVDATDFDPTFDLFGGGGLVSTPEDVAHFFRALFTGQIFKHPYTLASGLAVPNIPRSEHDLAYAPLMPTVAFGPHRCWGKTGFWGSIGLYCPDIDLAVALTVNRGPSATRAITLSGLAAALDAHLPQTYNAGRALPQ